MNIFFDIHKDLPREGPGDCDSTRKALSLIKGLPTKPTILDIGCGPGTQTLDLARYTNGKVIAVDTHQPFLDQLQKRAQAAALSERIIPMRESMFTLPFPEKSFDLLWSEGAIYIIGFEQGLRTWRPLLKPGGHVAATEITWLKPNPPQEIVSFWTADYSGMSDIKGNQERISAAGYQEIDHFVLPSSSWWTEYYTPIEARLPRLREKYQGNAEAIAMLDSHQQEVDMYRKYSEWYGYVFYIMRAD